MTITKYHIFLITSILVQLQDRFPTTVAFVVSHYAHNVVLHYARTGHFNNNIDGFVLYNFLSDDGNDISGHGDSGASSSTFEEMRRLLENAWNIPMGRIPTTQNNAVEECVDAMQRLVQNNLDNNINNNIFFIDILLPQYDISYGEKIYDEVYTAEFCIQFVQQIQIPTVIVYKDQTTVNTILRILNARNNANITGKTKEKNETSAVSAQAVEYDDFDSELMQNDDPKIADFRKSLMQKWETATNTVDESITKIPDEEKLKPENDSKTAIMGSNPPQQQSSLCFRISSLFGNATISKGADMIEDVMTAVQMNDALPLDNEQMMMIVSPMSNAEMYAIRAIVNKYNDAAKDRKLMIVFFNCKLQPIPQEIIRGQTVYSILPLVGTKKDVSSSTESRSPKQPKVVVLCRFPYDWQVYVDLGESDVGFNCIASISVQDIKLNRLSQQRGPSMEWIQTVVQRYLQQQPPPPPVS